MQKWHYLTVIFTERNLTGLIKDSHLKLDEAFNCHVLYDMKEAFNVLSAEFKINDT